MELYGYAEKKLSKQGLLRMREVTVNASPELLRNIAKFLMDAADRLENKGDTFDHMHVDQSIKTWKRSWPQLVVVNPDITKKMKADNQNAREGR